MLIVLVIDSNYNELIGMSIELRCSSVIKLNDLYSLFMVVGINGHP